MVTLCDCGALSPGCHSWVCFCDSGVVDFLFIVTPIVGVCNCSMFCCTFPYVHSSISIILMGKRELIALKIVFLVSRDG